MADFPKTLTRRRDGATREVTNAREQVSAEFDGFAALTPGQRAAVTRATKPKAKTKKTAAKTTSTTRGEKGPAAPTAPSTTVTKSAAATPAG